MILLDDRASACIFKMFDRLRDTEIDALLSLALTNAGNYGLHPLYSMLIRLPKATGLSDHTLQQLCSVSGPETSRIIVAHHVHFPCYMYSLGDLKKIILKK